MAWSRSGGVTMSGDPFIQVLLDDSVICQLTPNEARAHAMTLLEALGVRHEIKPLPEVWGTEPRSAKIERPKGVSR